MYGSNIMNPTKWYDGVDRWTEGGHNEVKRNTTWRKRSNIELKELERNISDNGITL